MGMIVILTVVVQSWQNSVNATLDKFNLEIQVSLLYLTIPIPYVLSSNNSYIVRTLTNIAAFPLTLKHMTLKHDLEWPFYVRMSTARFIRRLAPKWAWSWSGDHIYNFIPLS